MKVYVNGTFIDKALATVSVFDRAFLYGDGLFETMRSYNGVVFRLKDHMDRLYSSMKYLKIRQRISAKELSKAIYDLLKINELKDANIRVSVSRGISENRAFNISKSEAASVVITAQSFTPRPLKFYEFGIKIDTSQFRKSSSSLSVRFKTPSYLDSIVARNSSMSTGSYETIYLNESGYVCEGTVSNIFMVKDGNKLLTPSVNCGLLAGVTRKLILELSPFAGLAVTEGRFDLDTLKGSAEVFITNSIIELIPVVKVDESVIKSGLVGPVTKRLLDLYRECVNNETMEL